MPKFPPHYFVISESKLNQKFPNAQFLLFDYEIKNKKDVREVNTAGFNGVCYKMSDLEKNKNTFNYN